MELRNSKHEIRNKHEFQNTNDPNRSLEFGKSEIWYHFSLLKNEFQKLTKLKESP
jgi:hypothetical protein